MNVLLLNGSPHEHGCTRVALDEVATELHAKGIDTTLVHIGTDGIKGCTACMGCVKTGYCVMKDDKVNECIDLLMAADGFIVGSPVYFAGPNASVCGFLDRMFYHKMGPYACKPAAAVTSSRRCGNSAAFDRLNKYFTIAQMPVVSSNYWNEIHGNTPEEARQDIEGLQTMRLLGRNMAWLLQCIHACQDSIPSPAQEAKIRMNFIR